MKSKHKAIVIIILLVCLSGSFPIIRVHAQGENWLTGWSDRQGITILNATGAGTNYAVFIQVNYDPKMQNDFDDLRFTEEDGSTLLDYWMEDYTVSTLADMWVEVTDNLTSSGGIIYLYYGNDAVSTTSNGDDTFLFFDDFSGASLNLSKWDVEEGDVTVTGGNLVLTGNTATKGTIESDFGFYINTASHRRFKADQIETTNIRWMSAFGTWSSWDDAYDQYGSSTAQYIYTRVYNDTQVTGPNHDQCTNPLNAWTEYTVTWRNNEVNYYQIYDLERSYTTGNIPDNSTPLYLLFQEGNTGYDGLVDWTFVRKFTSPEPIAMFGIWYIVGSAIILFQVPYQMWGYNTALIILGLFMVPTSGLYLVYGGRKNLSMNKLFYALIIFFMGCGLFIGGVMP